MKFEHPLDIDGRPAIWVPGAVMEEIREESLFPEGVYRWAAGTYLTGWDGGELKDHIHVVGDWHFQGELEDHTFKLGDQQIEDRFHYLFVLARPNWPKQFVPHFPCYVIMAGYRPGKEALPNNIVKFLHPAKDLKDIYR